MRIGIVCPYSWDIAGGVQFHIRDLAQELIDRGHEVSVLAPAENSETLPDFLVSAGPALPIHYNGSVARLSFGPRINMRVRRWLKTGNFDVIHVHEPFIPSLSMLALVAATCPVVATFHTALDRSRAFDMASPMLRSVLEKLSARIAVSQEARRTAVQYLGGDAFVIPNGVYTRNFATAEKDARFAGTPDSPTLAFLGRLDDINQPGIELIRDIADIFDIYGYETEIIAASIRNPIHVHDCALAGADIATVPYKVIEQMAVHPLTTAGIEKFQKDYIAVFGE